MADASVDMKQAEKYFSIVSVHHFHAKDAYLLSDYFIPRCTHYFLFTFGMSGDFASSNSIQFSEYRRGALVREKVLVRNQWRSFTLRYVQLIFWFTLFAIRIAPRRSWILTAHPPVCLFNQILRAVKRHAVALIMTDVFQYDPKRLASVIFDKYIRHCARALPCVLFLSPEIQKRHSEPFRGKAGGPYGVRKRWSFGIRRRFDEGQLTEKALRMGERPTTVIGYIGVIRSCVGLDNLIQYVQHDDSARLDIVGEGLYSEELRARCEKAGLATRVVFHGFLTTDALQTLAKEWICGTMLYDTESDLYSRYGEPGKAKLYLSLGLPILMTPVSYIADEIEQRKAGVIIQSNDPSLITAAVNEMRSDYASYVKGVVAMAAAYDYERKYDDDFSFMAQTATDAVALP